ncbi:hypothetical protein HOU10_gp31 [Curvibacter phage P26059B]|uniref:Uncharacterized protein n=1 Tax=Curvibacter phage P26059B TaxID=1983784 RepID=A0A384UJA4_9CAUD|nr:hypothetical protein HOU10_gp31 [Curvibacter phage P26059B]ASJ79307.1 hypothetical protein P26059B_0031 [Curvibacter phage P26059B]
MEKFKAGDRVVHLGGVLGKASRNHGMELVILEGPMRIAGVAGTRYIVDRPLYSNRTGVGDPDMYHANEQYLLKLI